MDQTFAWGILRTFSSGGKEVLPWRTYSSVGFDQLISMEEPLTFQKTLEMAGSTSNKTGRLLVVGEKDEIGAVRVTIGEKP